MEPFALAAKNLSIFSFLWRAGGEEEEGEDSFVGGRDGGIERGRREEDG